MLIGEKINNFLTSKSVEGKSLPLRGVDDVHGRDGLLLVMLAVGDGITDDILKENLEDTMALLVDETTLEDRRNREMEGKSLPLQGLEDVHGGDGLPLVTLAVGDSITDDILEENLEDTTCLLVNETTHVLNTTMASKITDGWLGKSVMYPRHAYEAPNQTEFDRTDFQLSSKTTWQVMRTCPMAGRYISFNKIYRCHHGQQRKAKEGTSQHSKDTGCYAKLTISIRRVEASSGRKSRNSDLHLETHRTLVNLRWVHNHAISIPAALKFRDVSSETCEKLEEFYRSGHSPASALNLLELELQDQSPEEHVLKSADLSLCPDLKFCYRSVTSFILSVIYLF
ncbi:uncharacterized protein LOC135156043 [Lytechinus pictus]|uniref:uncharacterized protein LOC135156043 n=1 Tax=Lytechinus pictus TaxID=7653 RepID=UPI0030B9D6F6